MRYLPLFSPLLLLLTGCGHDASDPFSLAPSTPAASWSPMEGSRLISSKFCQTLLPSEFGKDPLTLAQLIDIALQNNPSTKQTWAIARNAAAQYGEKLAPFFPNIGVSASYIRNRGTYAYLGAGVPQYTTQVGPDLQMTYTLFDFGQRSAASLAAKEALYYADLSHNQQIQTMLQRVIDDYYDYLYQEAVMRAFEANLCNAQLSLDAANEKFSLGLAALGDVAQARTQFLQAKITLTTQKQQVEVAFAQLAVDLGLPSNVFFKVAPLPEEVVAEPVLEGVESLVARAQRQRQDLLAAEADLRSKEASLLGAQRAVLPQISTSLDIGKYQFQQGITEPYHWNVQVGLTFPIFDGFLIRNQVKAAAAQVELSQAKLLQTELQMIQTISTAHSGVKMAAQNLSDAVDYLKAAELEFQISLSGYKAGTATLLDLISAQSSLSDARSKKAGSEKDWFTSLASLAYATGALCSAPCQEGEGEAQ